MASNEFQDEPTQVLGENDAFYHDRQNKIVTLIATLAGAAFLLLVLLLSLQTLRDPPPRFFKGSQNVQLIQELPLDQPGLSTNALFNWLVQSMIAVHSFNFINYTTRLETIKDYFTTEGFDSFVQALRDAGVFELVINKKYVFRALPSSAPQITKEGVLANHYLWKIKLPMRFQYRNVSESLYDDADLSILVVRVPTTSSPYGIKVLRYELVLRKGGLG
jgi:intracellular multiplication protein IcmL